MHPIDILVKRYPGLALPIKEGMRGSEEYKRVCLRGEAPKADPVFNKTGEDRLEPVKTPAGTVEVLYLADREDFVHAYRALCYHLEIFSENQDIELKENPFMILQQFEEQKLGVF